MPAQTFSGEWPLAAFIISVLSLSSSVFGTAEVRPVDGLVYPSAEFGHGRVDSRKLCITAAVAPGDHAIDTPPTHQRPPRVSLQEQESVVTSQCASWKNKWSEFLIVYCKAVLMSLIAVTGCTKLYKESEQWTVSRSLYYSRVSDVPAKLGHVFIADQARRSRVQWSIWA